ncbi:hypothetical protein FHR84_000948 [Actinopolyspora biskrensis]|uniref:Uncharacterized protein n=1 Tax=Actinopolyspora biskrensis TaxID=1470178 RepID=A0A852YQX6_9ACTN|nr:hypothetical protein [Actinopolyspora biskrensis]NYH77634.1 hypothetical protein [Actinopolyspora biskrensis]
MGRHSAVQAHVTERRRRDFAASVAELGAVRLSNEPPVIVTSAEHAHQTAPGHHRLEPHLGQRHR